MISLADYQTGAVDWLTKTRQGIVKCPAGGGKTIIASAAVDRVLAAFPRPEPRRITWLANTTDQCDQAESAIKKFPRILEGSRLRVRCWQSGVDCTEEDLLIVDECHHASAPTLAAMVSACKGARWGFSATPFGAGDPDRNTALMALFGWQMYEVPRDMVVDAGRLTPAKVHLYRDTDAGIAEAINTQVPVLLKERMEKFHYLDEAEQRRRIIWQLCQKLGIVTNYMRNRRVIELARRSEAMIVLVNTVEHGTYLENEIPGAVVCHAKMGRKKRREAINSLRDGALKCMIATSLADEGLDVPRASELVLACAGRSFTKVEQRTGRVLRVFEGKEYGIIHDFVDAQHSMLFAQHKSRLRLYRKLGYEIEE